MTFRRSLSIAFTHVLLIVAVLSVGFILSGAGTTSAKQSMVPHTIDAAPLQIMEDRGDDCWAHPDDHPADLKGQEGGSVIMSGGEFTDKKTVHEAALQWYFGDDHGFKIYGFCR